MTGRRREGNKDGAGGRERGQEELGDKWERGGKAEVNPFMFWPGWQAGRSEGTYLASYYKSTRSVKG